MASYPLLGVGTLADITTSGSDLTYGTTPENRQRTLNNRTLGVMGADGQRIVALHDDLGGLEVVITPALTVGTSEEHLRWIIGNRDAGLIGKKFLAKNFSFLSEIEKARPTYGTLFP